jgi:hypothetical protein
LGDSRPRTRGDERFLECQADVVDEQRIRPCEPGGAEEDVHAQGCEVMDRMIFRYPHPDPAHARHYRGKVESGFARDRHAERVGFPQQVIGERAADDRFRRHGSRIQRVSADAPAFDKGHGEAMPRRVFRRLQARRPGAHDDEIVDAFRFGVGPVPRPHALEKEAFVVEPCPWCTVLHVYNHPPLNPARARPSRTYVQRRMMSQISPVR